MRHIIVPALFACLLALPVLAGESSILDATILSERTSVWNEGAWKEGGEASVLQTGTANRAHQTQDGASIGLISQFGRNNVASQMQDGRNKAIAVQVGAANTSKIVQSGEGNLANTAQYGTGNYAATTQQGAYNLTMMEQTGGQASWVFQRGALNKLTPDQVPDTPAIILQRGIDADPKVFPLKGR